MRRFWRGKRTEELDRHARSQWLDTISIGSNAAGYFEQSETHNTPMPQAFLDAMHAARLDAAIMVRCSQMEAALAPELMNLSERTGIVRLHAYNYFGPNGSTGLLTEMDFEHDAEHLDREPRAVRLWLETQLSSEAKKATTFATSSSRPVRSRGVVGRREAEEAANLLLVQTRLTPGRCFNPPGLTALTRIFRPLSAQVRAKE
jgi:hypothetical protein